MRLNLEKNQNLSRDTKNRLLTYLFYWAANTETESVESFLWQLYVAIHMNLPTKD